jgi:arylsulfatase A-like enzyme
LPLASGLATLPTMGHFATPDNYAGAQGNGYQMTDKPNIIWLMGDQHRHHATGYAGDPNLHTPNLDHLAHTGVYCRNGGVSGNALCCPFRGSLLTGIYPQRCIPVHEAPLPDPSKTVAVPFNEAGYHTAWFGKWHVDGCLERDGRAAFWIVPPERRGGFQEWVGYENNNSQWDSWVHGGVGDEENLRQLDGFETDALTDLLIDYLERQTSSNPEQPFFATLSVQPPHWPTQCPEEFRKLRPDEIKLRPNVSRGEGERQAREWGPGYAGLIENWDWNIGRVLAALRKLGIAHNTHLMFFADHGEMLGSHGRSGKVTPYEESVRTPFIFGGESFFYNRMHRGATDALINHVDIAPTTLGLCGIETPAWMEGTDYSFVRDPRRPKPEVVPDSAYLQAIVHREQSPAYRAIITTDGWKYACTAEGPWLMFNLNDDPYEMNNMALVPGCRHQREILHERLRAKIAEVDDEFELPALPVYS